MAKFNWRVVVGVVLLSVGLAACGSAPSSPTAVPLTNTPVPPIVTSTPEPTSIAVTATLPPTPTPGGHLRLQEEFNDPQATCFQQFKTADAVAAVVDGGYSLTIHSPNYIAQAVCESWVLSDFTYEADIQLVEIPLESDFFFGLIFRVGGYEHYALVLGSQQNYCVYYAREAAFTYLTNATDFEAPCWVRLPEIDWTTGTLHLMVVAEAQRLDVYVNDELIAVVRDSQLQQGWLGFVAGTGPVGGLVLIYDNVVVRTAD